MRWTARSGLFMVVVGAVVAGGGVALEVTAVGLMTGFPLAAAGAFTWWLCSGYEKPLKDPGQLERWGRPANAEVRCVEDVTLAPDGTRSAELGLRVSPVNEGSYSTTRRVVLPKGRVPIVGATVTVKFDPNRRRDFVLLEENVTVEDHVTVAARDLTNSGF